MSEQTINRAQVLYEHLRAHTIESRVTGKKQLLMHPPEGLDKEELSALLALIGTEDAPQELKDIASLSGRKDVYYYDGSIMTKHYAELDTLLQEKDILRTIASVTRSDSAIYPRPTRFPSSRTFPSASAAMSCWARPRACALSPNMRTFTDRSLQRRAGLSFPPSI